MKKATSWCTEKDEKMKKVSREYLKNVKIVKDSDQLDREVGEIDFLTIPRKELIKVFDYMDSLRYKHNYDKKNATIYQYGHFYYDITDEMDEFRCALIKNYKMYEKELFSLFKEYLNKNTNERQYKNFAKLLSATCKLKYMDYDDYEYSYYNEHPHPTQKDINHDFVGDYELIVVKPFPLRIVQAMKDRLVLIEKEEMTKFDTRYSDGKFDEIEKEI